MELELLSTSERKKVASIVKKLVYQGRTGELQSALDALDADEYQVVDLAFFKGYKTDVEARAHYPYSMGKFCYSKARALTKLGQFLLPCSPVPPTFAVREAA